MVEDPYQVLGISHGATEDEIKKAYRRKAKEYHPDLHPNDPVAIKKMQEVNKAYDMLMNPEKYASVKAQQQRSGQQQQSTYNRGTSQNYGGYQGPGGWASNFGGFDFEDFFGGFGFSDSGSQYAGRPTVEHGDSPTIQRVIQAIDNRRYQTAVDMLTNVTSSGRNARWYYLSAVANHGLGNSVQAMDQIQRAIKMDPNNRTYQQLYRQYRQAEQTYETNAQGFDMGAMQIQKICMGVCFAQLLCYPFGCLRCIY